MQRKHEAIKAADEALIHLKRCFDALKSAKKWGLFDIFAGGMMSSYIKHQRLRAANREFEQARGAVQRFMHEATEMQNITALDLDLDGLISGIDIFLDNVFVDVYVQSKINESMRRMGRGITQIEELKERLEKA
ncbi:hypothetical protein KPC83_05975 [Collinsella sp. zg1085]|uniref:hypothetical protein n=1 Tax=Collinsella sp. zg1085 TaxID=2844380 RepID=UPI001C0BC89E|nr:hypothetical protein [Collinsella sp. zg1085]QWT17385.1 hypothetical protein KPC83_05975 [Collinsella sp. zg1085]